MTMPKPYLVFLAYAILIASQWPATWLSQHLSFSTGILLHEWGLVMGLPLLLWKKSRLSFQEMFPLHKPKKKEIFWTIAMTLALAILIDYLTPLSEQFFPPPPEIKILLRKLIAFDGWQDGLWRWFLICVTPAICEEFFFRGMFQQSLAHYWGGKTALFITAACFALIHGIPAYWHLYFLIGLFLSWLMFAKNNLWLPILAHLINNTWTFFNGVS
ncbi:MAG: type II CAAX endopeptidase family protein [Deltaproteobacteria bacterium]|nr:type II CAAX endopeptidase family protein [Deltaproteobacteria bacterium]